MATTVFTEKVGKDLTTPHAETRELEITVVRNTRGILDCCAWG